MRATKQILETTLKRVQAKSLSNRVKVASVRFVAAKDHRKPVIAILQDHFDVPSIVICSACSRLSMWVSGSTLKVRLAATWKKYYNLVSCVWCVFILLMVGLLLSGSGELIPGEIIALARFVIEPVMAILALHFDVPSRTDCLTVLMCAECPSPSMLNTHLLHTHMCQHSSF